MGSDNRVVSLVAHQAERERKINRAGEAYRKSAALDRRLLDAYKDAKAQDDGRSVMRGDLIFAKREH